MKQYLLIVLILCAAVTAMVPRQERAVNTEEEEFLRETSETTPAPQISERIICPSQTPCGWSVYNPTTKSVYVEVKNSYCDCGHNMTCEEQEIDEVANAYVRRCTSPEA